MAARQVFQKAANMILFTQLISLQNQPHEFTPGLIYMSDINIKRIIENIRHGATTVYTPIIEMIVNAIQAIDETGRKDGKIQIRVHRNNQRTLDGALGEITGFTIEDNGIGFNDAHRAAFDTLYTDYKMSEGGKGFGRFTSLKYFDNVSIKSVYYDSDVFKSRNFSMGKTHDIIVNEENALSDEKDTKTVITLTSLLKKAPNLDKKLSTISRNIIEQLLPYFIRQGYSCPEITLSEYDGSDTICFNDFLNNKLSDFIKEIKSSRKSFILKALEVDETFTVRIFKLYSPGSQKSSISLVAHKREVSKTSIHKYIPEFVEDFYEKGKDDGRENSRNYIIKVYVLGDYLDRNVSLERGRFDFPMGKDEFFGIGQADIEEIASDIAREAVGEDITLRKEKKKERVRQYVDKCAPWHKATLGNVNLNDLPYRASNEEIEAQLQKEKFNQEISIKRDVEKIIKEGSLDNEKEKVIEIVNKISETGQNDLTHYLALRKYILDVFEKSLETDALGKYVSEGVLHDIIFPRKGDTNITPFDRHHLWIIDERLNFTSYVSSDLPLNEGSLDRPDLLVYNRRVLFRGSNNPSNPITVFEFKKPQRDDFVNPSSKEDPVQQIVRYVNKIKDGEYKTPKGLAIKVAENTPFYGYVVCSLTPKVKIWLEREKDFTPMPDRNGWFKWMGNINLYIEALDWEKVLDDAKMRNAIFFNKLGI